MKTDTNFPKLDTGYFHFFNQYCQIIIQNLQENKIDEILIVRNKFTQGQVKNSNCTAKTWVYFATFF